MAQQTIQLSSRAGIDLAALAVAADSGTSIDKWANTGAELVYVENASGAPVTVTLTFPATSVIDGQAPTARTVSVPATTGKRVIGPFPTAIYNDASGNAQVSYSATTSVKICVFKVGS